MPFESRGDQIFRRFVEFHQANPTIYALFEKFAFELIRAGRKRYGVSAVIERIRWHVGINTTDDEVKINNDFRAYYARMFAAKNPAHANFFEVRRRKSADRAAYKEDIAFMADPVGDETLLTAHLELL